MSNSKEWHKWRAQGIGSSDVSAILGISPWMTALELWQIKTGEKEQRDLSNNFAVQRGVEYEPRVRNRLDLLFNKTFEPAFVVDKEFSFMRVSLDGKSENTIIEIKCPGRDTIEKAKLQVVPDHYMAQIQYQLMVTEATSCIYACYDTKTEELATVVVLPDFEFQKQLREKVKTFWLEHVEKKIPPELSENDFEIIKTEDFAELAKKYKILKTSLNSIEEELDVIEQKIKSYSNSRAFKGFGITVTKYFREGAVDYKKIPELKGVNLDHYRKPKIEVVKLSSDGDS